MRSAEFGVIQALVGGRAVTERGAWSLQNHRYRYVGTVTILLSVSASISKNVLAEFDNGDRFFGSLGHHRNCTPLVLLLERKLAIQLSHKCFCQIYILVIWH